MKLLAKIKHFFVHNWGNWGEQYQTTVEVGGGARDTYIIQDRQCSYCNRIQSGYVKVSKL